MTVQDLSALFTGLFDDAAMFPPGNAAMPDAVAAHVRYGMEPYADVVGPFVCPDARLAELEAELAAAGVQSLAVAVTVPDGPHAVDPALSRASASTRIRVVAVEVPLAGHSPDDVGRLSQRRGGAAPARYVEVPVANVTGETVAVLRAAGLHLKLRTGGTTGAAFPTESDLTHAILRCVTNEASFKCTAGLHYAVRHRDPETGFEHHGFLNVALATLAALQTGDAAAVRDQLVEQDAAAVAKRTAELDTADIAAIRSRFGSFGTCSIADPLADLARMGLVSYR